MADFELLFSEHESLSEVVAYNLQEMLNTISSGRVPSEKATNDLEESIAKLRCNYSEIKTAATPFFEEGVIDDELTVVQIISKAKKGIADQLEKKISSIEKTIELFVQVQAKTKDYADALLQYQNDAQALLDSLRNREKVADVTLDKEANLVDLFMTALQTNNLGSEESFMDELDKAFMPKVSLGLVRGKYYLADTAMDEAQHEEAQQIVAEAAEEYQDAREIDIELQQDLAEPTPNPPKDENPAEDIAAFEENDESQSSTQGEAQPINVVAEGACRVKGNTAEFKSLISSMKGPEKLTASFVLPLLTNIGVATESQILKFGFYLDQWSNENDEIESYLNATLAVLCKKGVLVSYSGALPYESIYCLTPFALSNLGKPFIQNTMASIWSVSFGKVKFSGKKSMPSTALCHMAQSNDNLLVYLDWAQDCVNAETFELIMQSIQWQGECYSILVPWDKQRVSCSLREGFDGSGYRIVVAGADEVDDSALHDQTPDNVYLLSDNVLKKWNGEWVEERFSFEKQNEETADNVSLEGIEERTAENLPPSDSPLPEEQETHEAVAAATLHENKDVYDTTLVSGPGKIDNLELSKTDSSESDTAEYSLSKLDDSCSAREYAAKMIECGTTPENREACISLVHKLISEGCEIAENDIAVSSISQALVLLKALSTHDVSYKNDYLRFAMAVDSSIEKLNYGGDNLIELFGSNEDEGDNLLLLLSLLRALFTPNNEHDYSLKTYAQSCFENFDNLFAKYDQLKALFNLLVKLNNGDYGVYGGFTQQVLRGFSKAESKQDQMGQIQETACRLLSAENVIISGMNAMLPMKNLCFGKDSSLGMCLSAVAENKREDYELVEMAYSEFCDEDGSSKIASQKRIDEYCNECWKKAVDKVKNSGKRGGPRDLENRQRTKVIKEIADRLEVIESWLSIVQSDVSEKTISPKLYGLRNEIIAEIDSIQESIDSLTPFEANLILTLLKRMKGKLEGNFDSQNYEFADLLRTGIFCLDETGKPVIDDLFDSYQYYEPWRNAFKHISLPISDFATVLENICDPECISLYDNIGQAIQICNYLNHHGNKSVSAAQYNSDVNSAKKTASGERDRFKGDLELAFMYGRIQEPLREDLSEGVDIAFEYLADYQNFACVRAMIDSMRRIVEEDTDLRREELVSDIENRRKEDLRPEQEILLAKAEAELQAPRFNFVLAEEHLNRFDSDISDFMEISNAPEDNHYLNFINEQFDELYKLCVTNKRKDRLSNFGWQYIQKLLSRKQFSTQYQKESEEFLKSLPASASAISENGIIKLLRSIGFRVRSAEIVTPRTDDMVRLSVNVFPDSKNKTEFSHPIHIMGTKIKSPIDVICLYGWKQANDIVEKVCKKELHGTAIVFLNGALSSESRRELAEKFHRDKTGLNSFLLIDWVLMLYLAQFEAASRLPVMLNCTLPYASSYQPFVLKGSVSDEMFIGRKRELNQILDPSGPVIVYGGRQLGKTALLERAQSYANDPEKKEYAFLIRATEITSEERLVNEIVSEMNQKGLKVGKASSTIDLRKELRASYGKGQWKKMLLLIDEADKVLESMAPKYSPIIAFSDLSHDTGSDFKFVFAGLHNVCRAANEPNTIFGQLGDPLCITPLSQADAYELLVRPLRYMGFTTDTETAMRILVNTSFYPGIVHAVGYSLVENLMTRYSIFYSARKGNPPYALTDEQLRGVISGVDLNDKIDERIRWTLQVDPRYFMLARCIAYLYYDEPDNNKQGHSVDAITQYAELLGIACLEGLSKDAVISLLKEMEDMGILVEPVEDCFRLRQRRFLTAIGRTREVIEEDIEKEQEASSQ